MACVHGRRRVRLQRQVLPGRLRSRRRAPAAAYRGAGAWRTRAAALRLAALRHSLTAAATPRLALRRTWRWCSSRTPSATTWQTCVPRRALAPSDALGAERAALAHAAQPAPRKPLVVSLHGPPGVGKTYFHKLLAEAVYNMTGAPGRPAACDPGACCMLLPGSRPKQPLCLRKARPAHTGLPCAGGFDCPGYRVVFGTDYLAAEREQQAAALHGSLVTHLRKYPESILVIEGAQRGDGHAATPVAAGHATRRLPS
jgi:hypothetical protein